MQRRVTLGVTTDALAGTTLTIDILENGAADTLKDWVKEVGAAVQAEVLVSDDADGLKTVADEDGLKHQVCKSHVVRNTEERHDAMVPELTRDADGSLAEIGVTPQQALADNDELLRLIQERQPTPEAAAKLEEIHCVMRRPLHRAS